MPERSWWGWGTVGQRFDLSRVPEFLPFLRSRLGPRPGPAPQPGPALDPARLTPPALTGELISRLSSCLGSGAMSTDPLERVLHAGGKGYVDLVRSRRLEFPHLPDVVVFPRAAPEVSGILAWAERERVAVIPFGGGTSVVGGVAPRRSEHQRGAVSLDLSHLNGVETPETHSLTARAQAGCFGPHLESRLAEHGVTLGHFPQSFEFSTVGGWIATRSAGMMSTTYGKIEDMVAALSVVTPRGMVATRDLPATATGPGLLQTLIGSEGILGVITEATLRLRREPEESVQWGAVFPSFSQAAEAIRLCAQDDCAPAMIRASDEAETEMLRLLRGRPTGALKEWVGHSLVGRRPAFLALGAAGGARAVRHTIGSTNRLVLRCGGRLLPLERGENIVQRQMLLPYLRDALIAEGMLVETLETATTWSNLPRLYAAVRRSIADALRRSGVTPWVGTHCSHAYRDGASLYFTFLCWAPPGEEIRLWESAKTAACEAILAHGGTLSHHHGVGRDHARWLPGELGETGMTMIRALKRELDPAGVCNPGVVI
ncbi:MAG: FAD-binding oxidoreductase [Planctomycetes bacterium]|nr:FAD-binding oxidoreductase [Planctomycetota bacterium]